MESPLPERYPGERQWQGLPSRMSRRSARLKDRREIPDDYMRGLYLIVQPTGAKSWAVRYRDGGKLAKHTIGPDPAFGLKQARDAAAEVLRAVAEGRNPKQKARRATLPTRSSSSLSATASTTGPSRSTKRPGVYSYMSSTSGVAGSSTPLPGLTCGRCSTGSKRRSRRTACTALCASSSTGRSRTT